MNGRTRRKAPLTLVVVATASVVLTTISAQAGETELISSLDALKAHLQGTTPLSDSQIEAHKLTIDANRSYFGNSSATISASFDLVSTYDSVEGPLWANGSTVSGTFYRNDVVNDIHWTMFNVMQNIMDDTYNATNIATNQGLLDGYKFGSSSVFPGAIAPPADPNATYTATINGSFPNTYGRNTMHWADRPARKPTGAYLAPGSIATVTVPQTLVDSGYSIRVCGNSWDFSNKNPIDRLDRVSLVYDIDSTEVQVASPLGGGIYIEVPFEADAGVVDVQITNAVRSPFFSATNANQTTLSEWQNVERHNPAPWADFQSEKFMMHVPTDWIYNLSDPVTVMQNWDKAMDITNDLMGFPRDRGKETLFDGVDVRIRAGAYAPGYPSVNATYNPKHNYGGLSNSHLIRGPQYTAYYEFHELGHGYLFPKFPGETESNVNLLHVAVMQQGFGVDWDTAHAGSMGHQNNPNRTLDNTAVAWMTSFNFFTKKEPMHKLEKQYQLKGHAKFTEIARLYGWDKLGDYYQSFNEDYENGVTSPSSIDGMILRLSEACGEDITPLFHFWGVHPLDLVGLKNDMDAAGLPASHSVYDQLRHYRSLVPEDNTAFRQFAQGWWNKSQPSIDGWWTEHEHARQWDETDLSDIPNGEGYTVPLQLPNGEMYTEDSAALIRGVIDDLIQLYYLEFLADLSGDGSLDATDWLAFRDGVQLDMSGLTEEQAYALGDLDHDFDNDIDDFDLFRRAYESANPEPGAFAAMVAAAAVPEPSSLILLVVAAASVAGLSARRRRNARAHDLATSMSTDRSPTDKKATGVGSQSVVAVVIMLSMTAGSTGAAEMFNVNLFSYGKSGATYWDQQSWRDTVQLDPGQAAGAPGWNTTGWQNVYTDTGLETLYGSEGSTATFSLINQRNSSPYNWTTTRNDSDTVDLGNAILLDGHSVGTEDPYDGSKLSKIQVTSIPFETYDVVVYFGINGAQKYNGKGTIDFDGNVQQFTLPTSEPNGSLTQVVNSTSPGNYIVYEGVSGSSFSATIWGEGFTHLGPAGFQIVEVVDPTTLTLQVDTVTGGMTLLGDDTSPNDINYYQVTSSGQSLDPAGWLSLADQDFDGNGSANGSGNGWEEGGGIGSHALAEGYLLGSSTIDPATTISLGRAYDTGVDAQDLSFKFRTSTGSIRDGVVEYVATGNPGDFDADGDVDIDDVDALTAVGNLAAGVAVSGENARFDLNGDNTINSADLDQWLADAATANGRGAPYFKGDANLDADVDVFALDGSGDAQTLSSHLGEPHPDGHDVGPEEAEAFYSTATGELFFDVGEGMAVVGIGADQMIPGNVDTGSIFGAPAQNDGVTLAYYSANGLPVGEDSVGMVLPLGLTAEDMDFLYTPVGGETIFAPVTMLGAVWSDGDFNGDGDVDVFALDGSGDAQLLSSNLGLTNDAAAGTATAIYNAVTGELTFDVGENIAVIGIEATGLMHEAVATDSTLGAPAQNGGGILAWFNASGLTAAVADVGAVLPAGLAAEDIGFSFTPIGGDSTIVPITVVVPEPSTMAMLLVFGAIGLWLRKRPALTDTRS